jgi:hypothetical protein
MTKPFLVRPLNDSGCKAEESRLRTAERLANLIAVFCILSWRVFWMTMLNRSTPSAPPGVGNRKPDFGARASARVPLND